MIGFLVFLFVCWVAFMVWALVRAHRRRKVAMGLYGHVIVWKERDLPGWVGVWSYDRPRATNAAPDGIYPATCLDYADHEMWGRVAAGYAYYSPDEIGRADGSNQWFSFDPMTIDRKFCVDLSGHVAYPTALPDPSSLAGSTSWYTEPAARRAWLERTQMETPLVRYLDPSRPVSFSSISVTTPLQVAAPIALGMLGMGVASKFGRRK
jgi:hypothetical protein